MEHCFFYIDNLGCHLRSHDIEKIKNHLINNDFLYTENYEQADFVIVTGCLSDLSQLGNSNEHIAKHVSSAKKVVLTGCISADIREKYKDKILHVPPHKLDIIDEIIKKSIIPYSQARDNYKIFPSISSKIYYANIKKYSYNLTFFRKFRKDLLHGSLFTSDNIGKLHFLKISTGCIFNCSFCNTRFCFEEVISKPLQKIQEEYEDLIRREAKEVAFISEDIGSYGKDINTNLFDLLMSLKEFDGKNTLKWHLDAINPYWSVFYEDKLVYIVSSKKVKSIVMTIQSASSRILKLMNRYNDIIKIEQNIYKIKKANSYMKLVGFFMVGFPSETNEEFLETINFIKRIKFDEVMISCYSEFEHCQSAGIFPKVPQEEIMRRYHYAKEHLKKHNIFCKN